MPPVKATVSWPAGAAEPVVTPDPILVPAANGATVIQWESGENVSALSISGLDPGVFHPAASNGMVNKFSTTDANRDATLYKYTFGATRKGGGTAEVDPRIQNGA
jgi:anti-sigma factor RsiW